MKKIARLLMLTFVLRAPARAQAVPAEPTPAESARAIDAQAAADPAAAGAALDDLFRRLASPRVVLPTWAEVQQDRMRRDPAGPPASPETSGSTVQRGTPDPLGRATRESIDVVVSRPFARVGLGAGWTGIDVYKYDQRVAGSQAKYLFLAVDLSRVVRPAKLLAPPVLVEHALTETSPSRVRVQSEEIVVDSLKLPKD